MSTERTAAPTCPYCGHEERDAWEIDVGPSIDGDTCHTCNACDRNYFLSRHVSISYSSRPLIESPKSDES